MDCPGPPFAGNHNPGRYGRVFPSFGCFFSVFCWLDSSEKMARSDLGASFLMPAITAVVLGGANIYGGSGSIIGTAIAVLLVGYLQQGLQMAGVPNQVSSALSGALLIVVVVGRSVSLHRQQIKEWLARRANNPLP